MPLPSLLKKASNFLLGSHCGIPSTTFNEGEIVFCKNNVCVHPPTLLRQNSDVVHHPGYLTVTCQQNSDINKLKLHLSWIPNTTLRRNPWAVEKRYSQLQSDDEQIEVSNSRKCSISDYLPEPLQSITSQESILKNSETRCNCNTLHQTKDTSSVELQRLRSQEKSHEYTHRASCPEHFFDSTNARAEVSEKIPETNSQDERRSFTDIESYSELTERSPEKKEIRFDSSPSPSLSSICSIAAPVLNLGPETDDIPKWMSSPEMLALQHNLTFPESATASPVPRRAHKCRRFSVDLSQMRSLRLFFSDSASSCGQLVVASRESQYKIFHFHHGGLDHLAQVLQEWNFLLRLPHLPGEDHLPYKHFMVCRPEVSLEELHPEEGAVPPLGREQWLSLLNEDGQVEDDLILRKSIFFGGLEPNMRCTVWPFLLHCFTFQSTHEEREQISAIRRQEYYEITRRRLEMDVESKEIFRRNIQCVVEKDVIRTDRGNPYFSGENNPHVEDMKNILLNYAVYNPKFGYTQGMSDLLAPVLAEVQNECDAFWCFVGLMQKAIFVCTPTDNDMDKNLDYLRELIHLMIPEFYAHLEKHADAMELLFCHRWILLCFKREFSEPVALRMWESCWANYLTDYFHLFLCLAIICIYSDDVIAQDLRTDEMLLHFSSLAMYMDGDLILRKARGLLHQFRQKPRVPCSLAGLCQLCGPGMWDSTHAPVVECLGTHGAGSCPGASRGPAAVSVPPIISAGPPR